MIVEILGSRVNVIVPPSIHPDTGLAYRENTPLYEIPRSELSVLSSDIDERIRAALRAAGHELSSPGSIKVASWVPSGNRDNAMVAFAGLQSRALIRGERTFMQAVREMESWVENFTERVTGDDVSVEKAVGKLIEFFIRDMASGNRALAPDWDEGMTASLKNRLGVNFSEDLQQKTCDDVIEFLSEGTVNIEHPSGSEMFELVSRGMAMVARAQS